MLAFSTAGRERGFNVMGCVHSATIYASVDTILGTGDIARNQSDVEFIV